VFAQPTLHSFTPVRIKIARLLAQPLNEPVAVDVGNASDRRAPRVCDPRQARASKTLAAEQVAARIAAAVVF